MLFPVIKLLFLLLNDSTLLPPELNMIFFAEVPTDGLLEASTFNILRSATLETIYWAVYHRTMLWNNLFYINIQILIVFFTFQSFYHRILDLMIF